MQKIEQLIQADHYSVDVVRSIGEAISTRWSQLMFHVEERMKLVMASTNWFKTAEQVGDDIFFIRRMRTVFKSLNAAWLMLNMHVCITMQTRFQNFELV
jgi:hypothetical protein